MGFKGEGDKPEKPSIKKTLDSLKNKLMAYKLTTGLPLYSSVISYA